MRSRIGEGDEGREEGEDREGRYRREMYFNCCSSPGTNPQDSGSDLSSAKLPPDQGNDQPRPGVDQPPTRGDPAPDQGRTSPRPGADQPLTRGGPAPDQGRTSPRPEAD